MLAACVLIGSLGSRDLAADSSREEGTGQAAPHQDKQNINVTGSRDQENNTQLLHNLEQIKFEIPGDFPTVLYCSPDGQTSCGWRNGPTYRSVELNTCTPIHLYT